MIWVTERGPLYEARLRDMAAELRHVGWVVLSPDDIRIGRLSHFFSPGYSWCLRCHTTWKFVEPHVTDFGGGRGMFALCKPCWNEIPTSQERWPYYQMVLEMWSQRTTEDESDVKNAVFEETR